MYRVKKKGTSSFSSTCLPNLATPGRRLALARAVLQILSRVCPGCEEPPVCVKIPQPAPLPHSLRETENTGKGCLNSAALWPSRCGDVLLEPPPPGHTGCFGSLPVQTRMSHCHIVRHCSRFPLPFSEKGMFLFWEMHWIFLPVFLKRRTKALHCHVGWFPKPTLIWQ